MATRFDVDPDMSDQEIFDMIEGLDMRLPAVVETGEIPFPDEETGEQPS